MAVITRYPLVRHLRVEPTSHIRALRRGKLVKDGAGLAFWFLPLTAGMSEIPLDDRELPLLFHARTADFQDVTVQATVTYRIVDPALAAQRIDFALDTDTGDWRAAPLEQLAGLLTESAQQHGLDLLARTPLAKALVDGIGAVRDRMAQGLGADTRLAETGIAVIAVRVVAIRPEPEVERALQTPTREQVQQEADKATFERRALAVERERAIGENELQTRIELARREEELVAQNGANERLKTQESWAADAIATEAQARREVQLAEAKAQAARLVGEAKAAAEAARLAAYRDLSEATMLGLAIKELAANLPAIDHLTLSPDLLTPVLARLGGGRP
ncbi:SPFH domain-containing protein [[Mycobacterium] wendilense]|uniref:SPFH domain-containing protein n=1 Tax=[Mycobacterium] wendilense TaxID=3064284 RepID=A0ABM9MAS1_9MYCO|nr:SPFH domain-containing protein [Mycolicibacterium sp. MU0050]CAJ1580542.1 SPFH domain-containing protein [Mycolicibacterium sp. MU0050]